MKKPDPAKFVAVFYVACALASAIVIVLRDLHVL